MADLKQYQKIIQDLLTEIHSRNNYDKAKGIESQIIIDKENNHYLLVDVGWNDKEYVYGTFIHIDIKGDKIWIQRNNTEINLAQSLLERGINKDHIVIGLHSPFLRQFSGYPVS